MRSRFIELFGSRGRPPTPHDSEVVETFAVGDIVAVITAHRINGAPPRHSAMFRPKVDRASVTFENDELDNLRDAVAAAMAIIDHLEGRDGVLALMSRLSDIVFEEVDT